ncbi:MAG: hypothetical protein O3A10_12520 [Chloroflexi bacterium]|nr:hypothetical protein [Chloroflexota bacterium]MDA1146207.1 hypothetical protein [Chloroflexota bacterium]
MTTIRRFVSYYTRSSLPFLSGLVYGIFLAKWDHPLWLQVLAGLALVVLGPFIIQLVITLIVDALQGVPDDRMVATSASTRPLGTPSQPSQQSAHSALPQSLTPSSLTPRSGPTRSLTGRNTVGSADRGGILGRFTRGR